MYHRARAVISRIAIVALIASASVAAHEIPIAVRVQAFVKPEGQHLQLLVRVPLAAMTEVDFPRRGPGYLDLARADAALRHAAALVADDIDLYESDARLAPPRIAEVRVSLPSDRSFASHAEALAHFGAPPLASDVD